MRARVHSIHIADYLIVQLYAISNHLPKNTVNSLTPNSLVHFSMFSQNWIGHLYTYKTDINFHYFYDFFETTCCSFPCSARRKCTPYVNTHTNLLCRTSLYLHWAHTLSINVRSNTATVEQERPCSYLEKGLFFVHIRLYAEGLWWWE